MSLKPPKAGQVRVTLNLGDRVMNVNIALDKKHEMMRRIFEWATAEGYIDALKHENLDIAWDFYAEPVNKS